MRVLSCFDGISAGQLALTQLGITPEVYFASEIEKASIRVTQHNFPHTVQLGDIRGVGKAILPEIDIILAGSPCQDLSLVNANRQGLNGSRSGLFWEFLRF